MIQKADFLGVHHVRDIVREYLEPGECTPEKEEELIGAIAREANNRLPAWEAWRPYTGELYSERDEEITEADFRALLDEATRAALPEW